MNKQKIIKIIKESIYNTECYNDEIERAAEEIHKEYEKQLEKDLERIQDSYDCPSMGCGLEDSGITDRYEAMEYGFNQALNQLLELIEPPKESES